MTNYYRQLKIGNYPGDPSARRLIAVGIWLRVAFIGASVVAGALIALFGGEAELPTALAFVVGGAVATHLAWRRARALLDEVPAGTSITATPARDVQVPRLGASALR